MFEGAQSTLRAIFGMQMVELPVRDKVTKEEKRKGKHGKTSIIPPPLPRLVLPFYFHIYCT